MKNRLKLSKLTKNDLNKIQGGENNSCTCNCTCPGQDTTLNSASIDAAGAYNGSYTMSGGVEGGR